MSLPAAVVDWIVDYVSDEITRAKAPDRTVVLKMLKYEPDRVVTAIEAQKLILRAFTSIKKLGTRWKKELDKI